MRDCPYRGLEPFRAEHEAFFFGREAFIEDFVREDGSVRSGLLQAVKTKPLVAVVGVSGSGKSSLVFAGLLPRLPHQGWRVYQLRPGSPDPRPLHNLAAALLPMSSAPDLDPERLAQLNQLAASLRQGTVALQDVAVDLLRHSPEIQNLLLIVDQFEELFTLCSEDDRDAFLEVLLSLVC